MQAYNGPTVSEIGRPESSESPLAFDFRKDALPHTGAQDEFDIDEFISELDAPTQKQVDDSGTWVANTIYAGQATLATLRLRAGLSQSEFAGRCGIKQPHVSRYESGKHEPGLLLAENMAKVLNVTLEVIANAVRNSAAPCNVTATSSLPTITSTVDNASAPSVHAR